MIKDTIIYIMASAVYYSGLYILRFANYLWSKYDGKCIFEKWKQTK